MVPSRLVAVMAAIARQLDVSIVPRSIETTAQAEQLISASRRVLPGFRYSPPAPADAIRPPGPASQD
jgi:predicted signal transduction protein with EAL and GGDEF domain